MRVIIAAEAFIADAIAQQMHDAGFACVPAHNAAEVEKHAAEMPHSLLLWDRDALPGLSPAMPCLTLSRKPDGDALGLPMRVQELAARLQALTADAEGLNLTQGWVLHPRRRLLEQAQSRQELALTEKEAALLACLLRDASREATRGAILQDVWGYGDGIDTHTLETHLYRLRAKLKEALGEAEWIEATPSGYRFTA